MLAGMPGPLLGAVVLNLGAGGVADPAQRLETIYSWRMERTIGWVKALMVAMAVVLTPLVIDVATSGDSIDGTGRFFLAVAALALGGLVFGMSLRLERLEVEYSTAQSLLAAVRVPSAAAPPAPPPPSARSQTPAAPPPPPRPPAPPAS